MELARKYRKGRYHPENPKKYKGDLKTLKYRSGWELTFMQFCDSNPNVVMWSYEEMRIKYVSPVDRHVHTYWPDFLVKMKLKSGQVVTKLIEIKPYKQTTKPINKRKGRPSKRMITEHATWLINGAKWRAAKEWCDDRQIEFVIVTEKDLFKDGKKAN